MQSVMLCVNLWLKEIHVHAVKKCAAFCQEKNAFSATG